MSVSDKEKRRLRELLELPNIQGISIRSFSQPKVVLYVDRSEPSALAGLPATYNSLPVIIKDIGRVKLLNSIGASIGTQIQYNGSSKTARTTGSLGMFLFDGQSNNTYLITNNHVIALDFASLSLAKIGLPVYSPSLVDSSQASIIADLEYWNRVESSTSDSSTTANNNKIDLAMARLKPNITISLSPIGSSYMIDNRRSTSNLASLKALLNNLKPKLTIHKFGRTTGHTYGTIFDTSATIKIKDLTGTQDVIFENTIIVEHNGSGIAREGDSGSAGFLVDGNRLVPAALLFAGSDRVTLFNNLVNVIDFISKKYNIENMYTVPSTMISEEEMDVGRLFGVTEAGMIPTPTATAAIADWLPTIIAGGALGMTLLGAYIHGLQRRKG
jgi:hypothetical protein